VCSRSGLLNFEAIANESAGLYFLGQGDKDWGMLHLSRAMGLYEDWGAAGKAGSLEKMNGVSVQSSRLNSSSLKGRRNHRASFFQQLDTFSLQQELSLTPTVGRQMAVAMAGSFRDVLPPPLDTTTAT
jgi:hypothetical protein